MHEVFKQEVIYRDDLELAEGLIPQECALRDELLALMRAHYTDYVVHNRGIKDFVRAGLEEDIMSNARPIFHMLYGYIKWDDLVEQSMKDSWVCEELSDGSEWWFDY